MTRPALQRDPVLSVVAFQEVLVSSVRLFWSDLVSSWLPGAAVAQKQLQQC